MRRRALTMVELITSVALGMAVILMVYAAFRVIVTSMATGRRLAIENTVMRAGLLYAIEEVDFWRGTAAQAADQGAMTFSDDGAYAAKAGADAVLTAQPEKPAATTVAEIVDIIERAPTEDWWFWSDRLYDWRSLLASTTSLPSTANTGATPNNLQIDFKASDPASPGGIPDITTYALNRGFYKRSLIRERALLCFGHFGYLEYLPHHAVFAEWANTSEPTTAFPFNVLNRSLTNRLELANVPAAHPTITRRHEGGVDHAPNGAGAKNYASQDFFKATTSSAGATQNAWRIVPTMDGIVNPVPTMHTVWLPASLQALPGAVQTRFYASLLHDGNKPTEWPTLAVVVDRGVGTGKSSTLVSIVVRNPVTAQELTVHTQIMGSNLRGARRQRGLP